MYKSYISLISLLFFLVACSRGDDRTPEQKAEYRCESRVEAFVMSKTYVKKMLRSPSTAKFPWGPDSQGVKTEYLGDCRHVISAYVDAQNAFGGIIRSRYYVELQNELGTGKWKLLDIKISE